MTDRARELLLGCQDRVYNVCFQVLRHRQDAEDAAQAVLLRVAEEAGRGSPPPIPWIYRVALNTALNALKARKCRRDHELRRAAMATPTLPPDDDDAAEAIHDAIAALDDDPRAAVLQHFFEKRTLEDIARDQRCSAVAVWKRLEKAKTDLKDALARVGVTALLEPVLHALKPVAAPPTLVTDVLVAKAALLMSSAPLVAGGIAVTATTAKTFSLAAVAALALALFLTGIGGGYFLRAHPAPSPEPTALKATRTVAPIAPPTAPTPISTPPPPAAVPVEAPSEPLLARLQAFAALLRKKPDAYKKNDGQRIDALEREGVAAWREIRAQAYAEPAVFFAFLRAPENKDLFNELLRALGDADRGDRTFLKYPQGVIDGLADLVATGTKVQRRETATCVTIQIFDAGGAGPALARACFDRLSVEKDPDVLGTLINQLHIRPDCNPLIEAHLDVVRTLWDNNPVWNVREQCLEALAKATTPTGDAMFLEKMDEAYRGSNKMLQGYLPQILRARLPAIQTADEDRYVPLFATAFQTTPESHPSLQYIWMALQLSLPKAELILTNAQSACANAQTRAACERAVALIRSGETRSDLIYSSALKKP